MAEIFGQPFHLEPAAGAATGRPAASAGPRQKLLPVQALPVSPGEIAPSIEEVGPGVYRLAIPLERLGRVCGTASATIPFPSPVLLTRLADAVLRDVRREVELKDLSNQNRYYAEQVTQDFEELTFLRSMAEHLVISGMSSDTLSMAELLLPMLKELIRAEALVLTSARQEEGGWVPDVPLRSAGRLPLGERECCELILRHGPGEDGGTVVLNLRERGAHLEGFPGIRQIVVVPLRRDQRRLGWLLAMNHQFAPLVPLSEKWSLSHEEFGTSEATLLESAASILTTHSLNVEMLREKERLLVRVVQALVSSIEAKDDYTRGHSERVALFARRLAEEVGYDAKALERLYLTGLVHDVGKIGVSDATLKKEGRLSDEEFAEIRNHPDDGWSILEGLEPLSYVLPGVLHHHERFDGQGYPDGLKGHDIPLDGRIIAVADAYDAMTSDRPYRKGMPQERAEAILREGAGTQWDPELIDAFLRIMDDIVGIRMAYQSRRRPRRRQPARPAGPA